MASGLHYNYPTCPLTSAAIRPRRQPPSTPRRLRRSPRPWPLMSGSGVRQWVVTQRRDLHRHAEGISCTETPLSGILGGLLRSRGQRRILPDRVPAGQLPAGFHSRARGSRKIAENGRRPAVDESHIGQRLGADLLIEGAVRTAGDRYRITIRLLSTADGCEIWASRYDRTSP